MLDRKYRLSAKTRLAPFASHATPLFALKVAKNGLLYNRYGFIVAKRIDKRAVVRNKIRRRIRSCIEESLARVNPGFDMLFVAKKEAGQKPREVICNLLMGVFKKEGYIS